MELPSNMAAPGLNPGLEVRSSECLPLRYIPSPKYNRCLNKMHFHVSRRGTTEVITAKPHKTLYKETVLGYLVRPDIGTWRLKKKNPKKNTH